MRNAIIMLMVKDNRFQHDLNGFFSSTQSHKRHFIKTTLGFFLCTQLNITRIKHFATKPYTSLQSRMYLILLVYQLYEYCNQLVIFRNVILSLKSNS